MLVQLGSCQFVVKKEKRRIQVVGGGTTETMSVHGVLSLQEVGADIDNSIDNLRAMMNERLPQLLVTAEGYSRGYWIIEAVDAGRSKEEFKIKLRWYGERPHRKVNEIDLQGD